MPPRSISQTGSSAILTAQTPRYLTFPYHQTPAFAACQNPQVVLKNPLVRSQYPPGMA